MSISFSIKKRTLSTRVVKWQEKDIKAWTQKQEKGVFNKTFIPFQFEILKVHASVL